MAEAEEGGGVASGRGGNWHLAQVAIELPREAQARGHAADRRAHQVVEVSVGRGGQFQRAETDVVRHRAFGTSGRLGMLVGCLVGLPEFSRADPAHTQNARRQKIAPPL